MARLWQSGGELNSVTSGVEFGDTNPSAPFSISNTIAISGNYSINIDTNTFVRYLYAQASTSSTINLFYRFTIRIRTYPNVTHQILRVGNGGSTGLRLTTSGELQLWNAGSQVGSNSPALNLNTPYLITLKTDTTPANGSEVLSASINNS